MQSAQTAAQQKESEFPESHDGTSRFDLSYLQQDEKV